MPASLRRSSSASALQVRVPSCPGTDAGSPSGARFGTTQVVPPVVHMGHLAECHDVRRVGSPEYNLNSGRSTSSSVGGNSVISEVGDHYICFSDEPGTPDSPKEARRRNPTGSPTNARGTGPPIGGGSALHQAVSTSDFQSVRDLCAHDRGLLESRDATGSTPLFNCQSAVFSEFLLQAGAKPNTRNNVGQTPLHRACLFGRVDVMVVLLARGADARLGDNKGRTALEVTRERASKKGPRVLKLQAVVLLLEDHETEQDLDNSSINRISNYAHPQRQVDGLTGCRSVATNGSGGGGGGLCCRIT